MTSRPAERPSWSEDPLTASVRAAALAGARVAAIDLAANLIAEARLEARTASRAIAFDLGDGACRFREALTRPFTDHNLADDGGTTLIGEYLDVQARVR